MALCQAATHYDLKSPPPVKHQGEPSSVIYTSTFSSTHLFATEKHITHALVGSQTEVRFPGCWNLERRR